MLQRFILTGVQSYNVQSSADSPDPVTNAANLQAYIDSHPELSTVYLPPYTIPLGSPINLGARNMAGQGNATKLLFSGVSSSQDLLTVSGGAQDGGGAGQRAGRLSWFVIDAQGVGQDALRFTGGVGCGAREVTAINAGRDAFHFEQSADNRYFERLFMDNCDVSSGAGRYGICVRLADFGSNDTQFFNKPSFRNSRMYGCAEADIAFLMEDTDGAGQDTKIGGGVILDNMHAQFEGFGAQRRGCAVYVKRGASSISKIDWLDLRSCTFEHNAGNADANGALLVEDLNTGRVDDVIGLFKDNLHNLSGYQRWWDYNGTAPFVGKYDVYSPIEGRYSNIPGNRQFGTRAVNPSTTDISAGSSVNLFDASETGPVWEVTARSSANANLRHTVLVYGHSTPVIETIRGGTDDLTISSSGGFITANNADIENPISIYWSANLK